MNEEFELIKEKIKDYLDNKEITNESQYFLLLSLLEDVKYEILEIDEEDDLEEEREDNLEEDFEEEQEQEVEILTKPYKKPIKQSHSLKIGQALKKPPKSLKIKKTDEIE